MKPKPKPGYQWETGTVTDQQSYDLRGRMVNEAALELVWRGSLPADWLDEFAFLGKLRANFAAMAPI